MRGGPARTAARHRPWASRPPALRPLVSHPAAWDGRPARTGSPGLRASKEGRHSIREGGANTRFLSAGTAAPVALLGRHQVDPARPSMQSPQPRTPCGNLGSNERLTGGRCRRPAPAPRRPCRSAACVRRARRSRRTADPDHGDMPGRATSPYAMAGEGWVRGGRDVMNLRFPIGPRGERTSPFRSRRRGAWPAGPAGPCTAAYAGRVSPPGESSIRTCRLRARYAARAGLRPRRRRPRPASLRRRRRSRALRPPRRRRRSPPR